MVLLAACCAVCLTAVATECYRVLQSISYKPQRGFWLVVKSWRFALLAVCQCVLCVLYLCGVDKFFAVICYLVCGVATVFAKRKCSLVYTWRVKRMLCLHCALMFAASFLSVWFLALATPFVALLTWLILLPIETKINNRFEFLATNKLKNSGVTVIAVVGSYGKTSVKDMLCSLLDGAICPQGSCNTPLGIAKFVNCADLSNVKYVVLEFGARKKGDIAYLCQLYKPQYAIVTGVCKQHLSTFGSEENIIAEKSSIVELLPKDGVCVLGFDEIVCTFSSLGECQKIAVGTNVSVDVVERSLRGQVVCVNARERCCKLHLPQTADYASQNLALCIEMTLALGQNIDVTVCNASKIQQTPHRMQVIDNGKFFVVDDSYNGGIKGVENCCKTLALFDCKKVAIAQGIVECGNQRKQLNVLCGQMLADVFDVVIVVGKNSKYLASGASSTKVTFAADVLQATKLAVGMLGNGDVLYYQNDLPDTPLL